MGRSKGTVSEDMKARAQSELSSSQIVRHTIASHLHPPYTNPPILVPQPMLCHSSQPAYITYPPTIGIRKSHPFFRHTLGHNGLRLMLADNLPPPTTRPTGGESMEVTEGLKSLLCILSHDDTTKWKWAISSSDGGWRWGWEPRHWSDVLFSKEGQVWAPVITAKSGCTPMPRPPPLSLAAWR